MGLKADAEAGGIEFENAGHSETYTASDAFTGGAGRAVTLDANDDVVLASAANDYILGFLAQDYDALSQGDSVSVVVSGVVGAVAGGAVSATDVLTPDTTDAGAVLGGTAAGATVDVDEGGTATHKIATKAPVALEAAADGDIFLVRI